ncbi:hypothetical protein ZWY2020_016167 [Hordeum vulgare]|nr:hypothetical protein ZWY2020_016167 [Hordeum vulgare]
MEMEAAPVSAVTGALKSVLGKLATLMGDEHKRLGMARGEEIKSLADELCAMDAALLDMSGKEDPATQDKAWMNEARELSYDMEDSIDDFMQTIRDEGVEPDHGFFMEKMKDSLEKMKASRPTGDDLKEQINRVGKGTGRYETRGTFSNTVHATVDPAAIAMFELLTKQDGPKAELIKLLTEDEADCSEPLLAEVDGGHESLLAEEEGGCESPLAEAEDGSELPLVQEEDGPNPDMTSTLTALLLELTGEFKKTASVEQLIIDINESLLDKRYLIVIDGICQKETWEVIKHAFPMTSCGIIITTSPCEDIAELCRSSFNGHIYHIRPLERTEHLWNHMADSIGCALETSDIAERMMKILSLCYFDLHPRLKTCLLYLSMFPKGSTIKMKDLIWRWTAEGFFHGEQRNAAHELGEMCFNELLNRSLIQPVKIDQYGKVKSCQVHDTVMDYIISKSVEDNFVTFVGAPCPTIDQTQMKVRRFSLQATEGGYSFPGTDLVLSHARSLKAFGLLWEIPSLDKFKHLRVVDFGGFSLLGDDDLAYIGRLFQLRYLNLSWTRVCELPEEIGNLCCLEMLDLTATGVSKLPSSIVNLEKLAHLLIGEFVKFPEGGIEKMQALETLKQVRAFKQPLQFLQDFGKLQNLWKLNIDLTNNQEDSEETKECMKAIASSLYELGTHNLRSLTIWNCDYSLLLEEWCPTPVGLQKLITWSSTFPRVPDWMGSLVNLQQLRLDLERVRYEDLCILGGLPALLTLQIVGKEMSEGKLTVNGDMGFPMLRDFTYSKYPGLGIEIMFEAGSMPKLEKLNIDFTPATNEYLFSTGGLTGSGPFDFGIENLPISLTTVVCDSKLGLFIQCHSPDSSLSVE